jgi:hypothetical protein
MFAQCSINCDRDSIHERNEHNRESNNNTTNGKNSNSLLHL